MTDHLVLNKVSYRRDIARQHLS